MMAGAEIPAFGEVVAIFRTRAGLSQQKLANALGMSRRAIAAWEAGNNLPKTKGTVLELAHILKLNDEETTTLLKAAGVDPSLAIRTIPYPRNPFFTGRDQELAHLHAQLQQGTTAIVGQAQSISGLGGIGKTQLAVEYAYRHQDEYQYLLWARAESVEVLTASFAGIAEQLDLPEKNKQDQEITVQAVKRWLQKQRGWLLILDNADSPDLLPAFLPSTIGGHLLITTRAIAMRRLNIASPLALETLPSEQGALFLLHRAGLLAPDAPLVRASQEDQALAQQISQELGGLPLAIEQAAAYIEITGSSLNTYLSIYQQHRAELLKRDRDRPLHYPYTVATTWDISFQLVETTNPAAAELLRFCAFLAPDAIPEEILTGGAENLGPVLAPVAADAFLLNEAFAVLRGYSLLIRDAKVQTLAVHRLVQAVLQDEMDEESRKQWAGRVIEAVYAALPPVEYGTWSQWERIVLHAQICIQYLKDDRSRVGEAIGLLHLIGWYLMERTRYSEAEPLLEQAYRISEEKQGDEHPDTVMVLSTLAQLYQAQGKYREAEPLYMHALAINEKVFGSERPEVGVDVTNLASLYYAQGRYAEAELLYARALSISERTQGAEHLNTATCLNNLAMLYRNQGKYAEAEPLYMRALSIRERTQGAEHPDTATCLNNLATLYYAQRKYAEAESLYVRALAISERTGGVEHPDTATHLNNLATFYKSQRKYAVAEPLYVRALAISERTLGTEHPDVAACLNSLANLYYEQGKYAEAEPLYVQALSILERTLGGEHPDAVACLNDLANLYYAQGKHAEAEPLLLRALAISEQTLETEHPNRARSRDYLVELYESQRRDAQAELLSQRKSVNEMGPARKKDNDVLAFLKDLASTDVNTRAICLRVLLSSQVGDTRVLSLLHEMLSDTSPCIRSIPYYFCELRLLAAEALIWQRVLLDNDLPLFIKGTVRPISANDLGLLAESAGVLERGGTEGLLAAFVKLRDLKQLPLFDYIGDPYALRRSLLSLSQVGKKHEERADFKAESGHSARSVSSTTIERLRVWLEKWLLGWCKFLHRPNSKDRKKQ